jgi:GT2 family glycosyltransferase
LVVPIHNGSRHLGWFWKTLLKATDSRTEIILVDDGSGEDIFAAMSGCRENPAVKIIRHDVPRGFASAVNAGLNTARGEYLYILNSDLILEPNCLHSLRVAAQSDPQIGIVSATLFFPQTGGVQHAGIAFSETNHCHVFAHLPAHHPLVGLAREVQAVAFAACCIPRWAFERVGQLNEYYFNSYEDFDYCFRVLETGGKIIVHPGARGHHWERQSGPIRSVLRKDNVARLWRDWGSRLIPDLNRYLAESWAYVATGHTRAIQADYTVLVLARGRMSVDVLDAIDSGCVPLRIAETWHLPQKDASGARHWLPLILPVHADQHPRPFAYVVDSFTDLSENRYWFSMRHSVVDEELVIDLCGNILPTSRL